MNISDHIQNCDENLRLLILDIASLANIIKQGFYTEKGLSGTTNIFGEEQKALDKWADETLVKTLEDKPYLNLIASEERETILEVGDSEDGYAISLDPLDGSSLLGVNLTVGTIVGIYKHVQRNGNQNQIENYRPKNLIAALYILYGPLTSLVYTIGNGVHEFVLNNDGKFQIWEENLTIQKSKIYALGGLRKDYLSTHKKFIELLEQQGYKLRFSGSFVADVHQILHKGGVFTYPATSSYPNGKLRLLFEAFPMSKIIKEAGGACSTGSQDILSIEPTSIDNRIPVYIGGKYEIDLVEKLMRN